MKRAITALPALAIAALLVFFVTTPKGAPVRTGLGEWLAACALPAHPEKIALIELAPTGKGIRALDAALVLRSVLRCAPRAIAFLDPIEPGEAEALLLSKLSDTKIPVVFTSNEKPTPLPAVAISPSLPPLPAMAAVLPEGHMAGATRPTPKGTVLIAARQGSAAVASNLWQAGMAADGSAAADVSGKIPGSLRSGSLFAPADSTGCATINPLASQYVQRISFDQLMLKTERSEQGAISLDLDALFRGRLIAIQNTDGDGAIGLAALQNRLAESPLPAWLEWIGLLVVATIPWWRGGRIHRALFALGVTCTWALMAIAIYQEFRIPLPLSIAFLLPLLALISPIATGGSNKVEQRKLPA